MLEILFKLNAIEILSDHIHHSLKTKYHLSVDFQGSLLLPVFLTYFKTILCLADQYICSKWTITLA